MTFKTLLIDSSNYRNFKNIRYALYFAMIIIGAFIMQPRTQFATHPSISEKMGWNSSDIIGVLLIIGTIAFVIYSYSKTYKIEGQLTILEDKVKIENKHGIFDYRFNEMNKLEINRGATYHYEYQSDNYLHEANNWLSFHYNGETHQYEFIIDSMEKNAEFEKLVEELKNRRIGLAYLSI